MRASRGEGLTPTSCLVTERQYPGVLSEEFARLARLRLRAVRLVLVDLASASPSVQVLWTPRSIKD